MSTHLPEFQSYDLAFLHHFVMAILAPSSIRVKTLQGHCKKKESELLNN